MNLLEQARVFRETFGQESLLNISRYGFIKKSLWDMQTGLIKEEASELLNAADELFADPENEKRREELVKEMCDLVFVVYQLAATYNIDLDEAMSRVFESNMSKLDDDGKAIYREDGKILKGPNYVEPDFTDLYPVPYLYNYDTSSK